MPPTSIPTTLPLTAAEMRQGFFFALCLGFLIPAAGFFPIVCAAALKGRRRGLTFMAVLCGVGGITAAFLLTPAIPGIVPFAGMYYVLAMAGVIAYGLFRRRWPAKPGARRVPAGMEVRITRAAAGNGDATTRPLDRTGDGSSNGNGDAAPGAPPRSDRPRRLDGHD